MRPTIDAERADDRDDRRREIARSPEMGFGM
jgi:hypothetical protein